VPTLSNEPFAVDGCGNTLRVGNAIYRHGHRSERATITAIDNARRDYNTLTVVDEDGHQFSVSSEEACRVGADATWFFGYR
jgi:hypothetical protein